MHKKYRKWRVDKMKNVINTILRTGHSRSKKSLKELKEYCFFIGDVVEDLGEYGFKTKDNKFWNYENKENRIQFANDIKYSKKGTWGMFTIYNRQANGDAYGIESNRYKCRAETK